MLPSRSRPLERDLRVRTTAVVGQDRLSTRGRLLAQLADRVCLDSVLLRAILGDAHPGSLEGFAVEDGAVAQR